MVELGDALDWLETTGSRIPGEKIFLLTLIHKLSETPETHVQISCEELSNLLGVSTRSCQRHVHKLQLRGILEVENTVLKDLGRIGANKYRLPGWPR